MPKKKSYMNHNNLLNEGFFNKLFKSFKIDSELKDKIKSNFGVGKKLKNLNNSVSALEKSLEKEFGKKITLAKFKLSDFD